MVDRNGNAELGLAANIASIGVEGLLLNLCMCLLVLIHLRRHIELTNVRLSKTNSIHVAPNSLCTIGKPDLVAVLILPLAGARSSKSATNFRTCRVGVYLLGRRISGANHDCSTIHVCVLIVDTRSQTDLCLSVWNSKLQGSI